MPTLFKRSNGIYYAVLADEARHRRWVSTGERRKTDALKTLSSLMALAPNGQRGSLCLSEFLRQLSEYGGSVFSRENLLIYQRSFRSFISCVGDVALGSVTQRQIDNFKAARLKSVKSVTLNLELRTLRAGFYIAFRWKLITENPFKGVRLCALDDGTPPFFLREEFQSLLATIEEEWLRDLVLVAALTGMRRGELVHLRWSDVDMENRMIRVQSSANYRTKRGKSRAIPMSPEVEEAIERRKGCTCGHYVFHVHGKIIHERGLSRRFKRHIRRSELNEGLHFHSLRHSFASWLVQGGVSLYQVQKLLGHSSIKVTEIYSHLMADDLRPAVNQIAFSCPSDVVGGFSEECMPTPQGGGRYHSVQYHGGK
jgi:integrase